MDCKGVKVPGEVYGVEDLRLIRERILIVPIRITIIVLLLQRLSFAFDW